MPRLRDGRAMLRNDAKHSRDTALRSTEQCTSVDMSCPRSMFFCGERVRAMSSKQKGGCSKKFHVEPRPNLPTYARFYHWNLPSPSNGRTQSKMRLKYAGLFMLLLGFHECTRRLAVVCKSHSKHGRKVAVCCISKRGRLHRPGMPLRGVKTCRSRCESLE